MSLRSLNPATGRLIKDYPEMTRAQWTKIVEQAHAEFLKWRQVSWSERASRMRRAADLLDERAPLYAELMAREMGKPLAQGRAEIQKCAATCRYYADNAQAFLRPEPIPTDASKSYVTYQPLGVVLAIMPWNFPFWQVVRFVAPALMAGNAGVLKHAGSVSGCALALEDVFRDAGFPKNLFRSLIVGVKPIKDIIAHPLVQAVTLTGSTRAGRAVGSQAGEQLKKSVLELGGSDAYVVLEDADLPRTAETCAASRLINAGQSCIAAKRFIVVEKVRREFERLFVERMRARKMGDPMDDKTDIGPLARADLRAELHKQVKGSLAKGAKLLLGGELPKDKGAYYPATVLTNVKPGMPAFNEEMFGPVAAIISAKNEAEAIRLANDNEFGLGAAVFTTDAARGERIAAEELLAGSCFVNAYVRSDPRLPFGGIKGSGYGRELSYFGIREFVNIKTVYIAHAAQSAEHTANE
jgi:succinate-semialdehyde dehydrogenase / glutarate-semialdehyde dehydrogenase